MLVTRSSQKGTQHFEFIVIYKREIRVGCVHMLCYKSEYSVYEHFLF